jgi:hypothetical protein
VSRWVHFSDVAKHFRKPAPEVDLFTKHMRNLEEKERRTGDGLISQLCLPLSKK